MCAVCLCCSKRTLGLYGLALGCMCGFRIVRKLKSVNTDHSPVLLSMIMFHYSSINDLSPIDLFIHVAIHYTWIVHYSVIDCAKNISNI